MISQPAIFSVSDVTRRPRRTIAPSVPSALESARSYLSEAQATDSPPTRYVNAHLAALRVAAAVLAQRADPGARPVRGRRPRSAWELLPKAAPELAEWAAFFDAGAPRRAAAEAGLSNTVTPAEADALLKEARAFLSVAESLLGLRPPHGTD
ncbi:SAV_6107 family HEPN domain-containing protein [Actinorugispora endophytica]|uniref:SAV-6107-like HEPN domain-containing protein n=1 Tax=Actinorugispora endophytica TaxID=1605990 RepID=A0A4V3D8N9_9ACTN|nr:SAV_6107 family HEPN domain-containing protein [Actinorugispora endophytica]TDQ52539.1 hypothetical protein EV190_106178 [Actinorugispora endophytica]